MRGAAIATESATPLILSALLRRKQVQLPLREVLISSAEPSSLVRVLTKAQHRNGVRQHRTPSPGPENGKGRCMELLKDLPGFAAGPSPGASLLPPPLDVVALTTEDGFQALHPRRDTANLLALPLTLSDVAAFYQMKHQERSPRSAAAAASGASAVPPMLLEGKGEQDGLLRSCVDLHCAPSSKDLLIVDGATSAAGEDAIWEALFVAECTLKSTGTLLATSRHLFSRRVRRFLQWRFHTAHCATDNDGHTHYALCTALASEFGSTAVRRDDFPGLFSAEKRRPRKWNPYRREERRKFVMSVRPGFTNAPHTKDALLRNVAREKERDDDLRATDDAFFAVAHEMVEKGTHYSHPSN